MSPRNAKATGKHKSKPKDGEEVGADDDDDDDKDLKDDDKDDDGAPSPNKPTNGLLKRGITRGSAPKMTLNHHSKRRISSVVDLDGNNTKEDVSGSRDDVNKSGSGGTLSRGSSRRKTTRKLSKLSIIRHNNNSRR